MVVCAFVSRKPPKSGFLASMLNYNVYTIRIYLPKRQRPNTVLDSSKSVNTSPAATVYLCQRSSKLPDELFIQCAPWETVSYVNKQWWN